MSRKSRVARGEKQRKAERAKEAQANRKKYKTWQAVCQDTKFLRCSGCKNWIKIMGDVSGKTCRHCGAPLSLAQ